MPHRVFIGVGSNLGDRKGNVREALARLAAMPGTQVVRSSSLYESEPHGPAKNWFVNLVVELETEILAADLLAKLAAIEEDMGRKRAKTKAPASAKPRTVSRPVKAGKDDISRVIDLDILFFNTDLIQTKTLRVPHPEIPRRKFVLMPLAEVAPQLIHPETGLTVSKMLATAEDRKRVTLMPPH